MSKRYGGFRFRTTSFFVADYFQVSSLQQPQISDAALKRKVNWSFKTLLVLSFFHGQKRVILNRLRRLQRPHRSFVGASANYSAPSKDVH
ncbi:hypothetical protein J6590_040428 [Homalodisca vitripennis]|nr:hypothetical protein J6590_040428 [Homalodisca vitripennis]